MSCEPYTQEQEMRQHPEPWVWEEKRRHQGSRVSHPTAALRYLAKLSSVGSISEEETCEKLKGLIQRQVQMCKRNLEVMDSVRRGAQLAIEECQYQFRNRRWNCSTLDSLPVFGKVVTQGEEELFWGLGLSVCNPGCLGKRYL